jgi:hypothetical protein
VLDSTADAAAGSCSPSTSQSKRRLCRLANQYVTACLLHGNKAPSQEMVHSACCCQRARSTPIRCDVRHCDQHHSHSMPRLPGFVDHSTLDRDIASSVLPACCKCVLLCGGRVFSRQRAFKACMLNLQDRGVICRLQVVPLYAWLLAHHTANSSRSRRRCSIASCAFENLVSIAMTFRVMTTCTQQIDMRAVCMQSSGFKCACEHH